MAIAETTMLDQRMPAPRNAMAQRITQGQAILTSCLAAGIPSRQFVAACIEETNQLSFVLSAQEQEDRRTQTSVIRCVMNAAFIGLMPGPALGHAYFVPFKKNRGKPNEHVLIQLVPGYRGLLELAWSTGFLQQCDPEVVVRGEHVRRWHDTQGPQIEHEIPIPRIKVTPDNIIGAYCTYIPRGGRSTLGEFVEAEELIALYRAAPSYGPWKQHFAAMAQKTAIRRTAKRWRVSQHLALAIHLDEQQDRGVEQDQVYEDVESEPAEEPVEFDKLPDVLEDTEDSTGDANGNQD